MTHQFSLQRQPARAVDPSKRGSSLVRRLVRAENDAVKEQVRGWLIAIDDQQLLNFGFTTEEIAALRTPRHAAPV